MLPVIINSVANSTSLVASTLANVMLWLFFSFSEAFEYSGASVLQWPHLFLKEGKKY